MGASVEVVTGQATGAAHVAYTGDLNGISCLTVFTLRVVSGLGQLLSGAADKQVRTLVRIISSTPRVFLSGCSQARFAGNSGALGKNCNAAAAAEDQPKVESV